MPRAKSTQKRSKPLVLFVVGPTASGKTTLAIALAKRLKGEILSADSMLVYKGMDIGTAKPSAKELKQIPHHGIDLIPPSKEFSVFEYRKYALKTIRAITRRGHLPIVAGGTGFYVRALLEGLTPLPGANAAMRRKLDEEALEKGLPVLYERLRKVDPLRAKAIGPHNQRRIIRALEIFALSGNKPSQASKNSPGLWDLGYHPIVIGLNRDRAALYESINNRVDKMFRRGLVREVKKLSCGEISKTALQGVGYKEVLSWITLCGAVHTRDVAPCTHPVCTGLKKISLSEVKDRIKQATRHFAKRQWTWFKRERGIRWVWWPEIAQVQRVSSFIIDHFHLIVDQSHNQAMRQE